MTVNGFTQHLNCISEMFAYKYHYYFFMLNKYIICKQNLNFIQKYKQVDVTPEACEATEKLIGRQQYNASLNKIRATSKFSIHEIFV